MSQHWNSGVLKMDGRFTPSRPDGKEFFRKTKEMLESYSSTYDKIVNRRLSKAANAFSISRLYWRQLFGDSLELDEVLIRNADPLQISRSIHENSSDEESEIGEQEEQNDALIELDETESESESQESPPVESPLVESVAPSRSRLGFVSAQSGRSEEPTIRVDNQQTQISRACQVCDKRPPQCQGGLNGSCTSCPHCFRSNRHCPGAAQKGVSPPNPDANRCKFIPRLRNETRPDPVPVIVAPQTSQPIPHAPLYNPAPPYYNYPSFYYTSWPHQYYGF
jgi:hypothetical protein